MLKIAPIAAPACSIKIEKCKGLLEQIDLLELNAVWPLRGKLAKDPTNRGQAARQWPWTTPQQQEWGSLSEKMVIINI